MKKGSIVIGVIIVSLLGCQKEMSFDDGGGPPLPTVIDSNFLDKIYLLANPVLRQDTQVVITFTYDALKRITAVTTSTPNNTDYLEVSQYSYTGVDTMPYKSLHITKFIAPSPLQLIDSSIKYFYYNGSGKKVKDSLDEYSYSSGSLAHRQYIANYASTTDKIAIDLFIRGLTVGTGNIIQLKDTLFLDAKDNVTKSKLYQYDATTSNYELNVETKLETDNYLNPFYKLNTKTADRSYLLGDVDHTNFIMFNNISKIVTQAYVFGVPNPPSEYFYIDHVYNAARYPKEYKYHDPASPGSDVLYLFTYKKL